jgi:hypothetical protein
LSSVDVVLCTAFFFLRSRQRDARERPGTPRGATPQQRGERREQHARRSVRRQRARRRRACGQTPCRPCGRRQPSSAASRRSWCRPPAPCETPRGQRPAPGDEPHAPARTGAAIAADTLTLNALHGLAACWIRRAARRDAAPHLLARLPAAPDLSSRPQSGKSDARRRQSGWPGCTGIVCALVEVAWRVFGLWRRRRPSGRHRDCS